MMKIKAQLVPYSSVVGRSVSFTNEKGAVVAIAMITVPNRSFDYKETADPIAKRIVDAFDPIDLDAAIRSAIDMIDNCAGVPTEPDSLPQMVKAHLKASLADVTA